MKKKGEKKEKRCGRMKELAAVRRRKEVSGRQTKSRKRKQSQAARGELEEDKKELLAPVSSPSMKNTDIYHSFRACNSYVE